MDVQCIFNYKGYVENFSAATSGEVRNFTLLGSDHLHTIPLALLASGVNLSPDC